MPSLSGRHDFVFMFDVTDGNPNGDPDADLRNPLIFVGLGNA
jgi:CRISPR/Cas system type I-B associated protein Csh2 (Cas7 group RAMP superfamily)